jgi:hypothetical protein
MLLLPPPISLNLPLCLWQHRCGPTRKQWRSPDPQPTSQPTLQADIGQYIVIMEESGGNSTTIYPRVKKMKTSDKIEAPARQPDIQRLRFSTGQKLIFETA